MWQPVLLQVVQDAAPRLGGDLNVNGHSIVSSTDGDIQLAPDGAGNTAIPNGNLGIGTASFGTSAGGVVAIKNGTAPATSPTDTVQLWAEDRGGAAGKGALQIRAEDGTRMVLGDRLGVGTTAPLRAVHVETGGSALDGVRLTTPRPVVELIETDATLPAGAYRWEVADGRLQLLRNTNSSTPFQNVSVELVVDQAGNIWVGRSAVSYPGDRSIIIKNADAPPTSGPVDSIELYAADVAAGNAAAHFRTENGAVVKLYRQAHIADPGGGGTQDAEARTAINAILAAMENLGVPATS